MITRLEEIPVTKESYPFASAERYLKLSERGVLQEDLSEVAYRAFPSALVEKTTLDAAGLKVGDIVHVKDLDIAKNKDIDLKTDPEAVVLSVIPVHNVVPETEVTTAPVAAAAEEKETK